MQPDLNRQGDPSAEQRPTRGPLAAEGPDRCPATSRQTWPERVSTCRNAPNRAEPCRIVQNGANWRKSEPLQVPVAKAFRCAHQQRIAVFSSAVGVYPQPAGPAGVDTASYAVVKHPPDGEPAGAWARSAPVLPARCTVFARKTCAWRAPGPAKPLAGRAQRFFVFRGDLAETGAETRAQTRRLDDASLALRTR